MKLWYKLVLSFGPFSSRWKAINKLHNSADKRNIGLLIFALRDTIYISEMAAKTLEIIGDKRAVQPLLDLLRNINFTLSAHNSRKVKYIIDALVSIGDKSAIEPLILMLERARNEDECSYAILSALWSIDSTWTNSPAAKHATPSLVTLVDFRPDYTSVTTKLKADALKAIREIGYVQDIEPLMKIIFKFNSGPELQGNIIATLDALNPNWKQLDSIRTALPSLVTSCYSCSIETLKALDSNSAIAQILFRLTPNTMSEYEYASTYSELASIDPNWRTSEIAKKTAPVLAQHIAEIPNKYNLEVKSRIACLLAEIGETSAIIPLANVFYSIVRSSSIDIGNIHTARDIVNALDKIDSYWLEKHVDTKVFHKLIDPLLKMLFEALSNREHRSLDIIKVFLYRIDPNWLRSDAFIEIIPTIRHVIKIYPSMTPRDVFYEVSEMVSGNEWTELLTSALSHEDEGIRMCAVSLSGQSTPECTLEPLFNALKDESPHVKSTAAEELGKTMDSRAIQPLISAWVETRISGFVSDAIADALNCIDPKWAESDVAISMLPFLIHHGQEAEIMHFREASAYIVEKIFKASINKVTDHILTEATKLDDLDWTEASDCSGINFHMSCDRSNVRQLARQELLRRTRIA
jgi:HEAT repeat protein